jgi:hypothetical protein
MMKRENYQLTAHFSYNEMTRSAWAEHNHVSNDPDKLQLAALTNLCRVLLEPLRSKFGPIRINSAFRSPLVNEGVHGVGASKHLSGEAVDIHVPDLETGRAYFRFIVNNIDYDQVLFEHRRDGAMWLHCSVCLDPIENRHQSFPNYRVK